MLAIVFLVILIFILLAYRGCISIYICRLLEQQKGQLPPGPFSWPLIGALGIDSQAPWETLTKWASQFGPLTSFFYGSEFTVVLSDMETIKSAMKNPAFEGRPLNHSSKLFFSNGIGFAEGEVWKKHRRLVVSSLRVLGLFFSFFLFPLFLFLLTLVKCLKKLKLGFFPSAGSGTPQMLFDNHLKHCGEDLVGALQKRGEISSFDPASLLKHAGNAPENRSEFTVNGKL
jgi:Cytochrome P450